MKRNYRYSIVVIVLSICSLSFAGTVLESSWSDVIRGRCSDQNSAWWGSSEAIRIAENVLLYQRACGGWPKNTNMQVVLTDSEKEALLNSKAQNNDCTIDNGAVDYELTYLSKVYKAVTDAEVKSKIKEGFQLGVQYLLDAQYENGGWPQFYPYHGGYADYITYNDDAMVHVMYILKHVYTNDGTYSIVVADSTIAQAEIAYNKGIECILNTQYAQNGVLTVWCAQHNHKTLEPAMARSYELASLSGQESAGILELLMSIDNPSMAVKRAVYAGVKWYDENRIKGQRLESFINADNLSDKRIVFDASAPDMWARFYTLENSTPFFCDRDGIKKYSIAEIGYERRNGYSWYNSSGFDVIDEYNSWVNKWRSTVMIGPANDLSFYTTDTVYIEAFANSQTGSALSEFEILLDSESFASFTKYNIDTFLTDLDAGEHTIIVNAKYEDGSVESDTSNFSVSIETFTLTVSLGEGSGEYEEGSKVLINAKGTSGSKVFDKWIGDTMYVENVYDTSTVLIMPNQDISVRALYVEATGIDNVLSSEYNELNCYPNPSNGGIHIELSNSNITELNVFSIDGKSVYNVSPLNSRFYFDCSFLPKGVYYIRVKGDHNNIYTEKIILGY